MLAFNKPFIEVVKSGIIAPKFIYKLDRKVFCNMIKKFKSSLRIAFLSGLALLMVSCKAVVLDPKGVIASDERTLIFTAVGLMLIVVIPVFIMTFMFAWKYRASNSQATYDPHWTHSTLLEVVVWSVSGIIVAILATITWISSHRLDPYKPLDVITKPVNIQVIALDWKWLFIYPEENIATINYIKLPVNVPINFKITSDAPMNSFWIPQLGGQIYAMTGMQTQLHLMATNVGQYGGGSANFSGAGFSGMRFVASVGSQEEFEQWVSEVRQSANTLNDGEYIQIEKPSENTPVTYYSSVRPGLYHDVILKFMMPNANLPSRF